MENFNSASFKDIAQTNLGNEIWIFLHSNENRIKMETATFLKRPALEAIQLELLSKFGEVIRQDRYKQMLGKMVRQIMESRGYILDQSGVRISSKILFASATRYKKSST